MNGEPAHQPHGQRHHQHGGLLLRTDGGTAGSRGVDRYDRDLDGPEQLMATDAVRYGKRGRQEAARAAKERRTKVMLVVGAVLLLGLLAFEGPKTLKKLRGTTTPAEA